jgi:hypothetical protein
MKQQCTIATSSHLSLWRADQTSMAAAGAASITVTHEWEQGSGAKSFGLGGPSGND